MVPLRGALVLTLTFLASALAGCVADDDGADLALTEPTLAPILDWPLEREHDHGYPWNHNASAGLELLAWHPVVPDVNYRRTGYLQVVAQDGFAYMALSGLQSGMAVLDVRDPANPEPIGFYRTDDFADWDVKVFPDSRYALLATQIPYAPTVFGGLPRADEPHRTMSPGIHLIDIRDKTEPRFADFWPLPAWGAHTVFAYDMDGRYIILAAVQEFAFVPVAPPAPLPVSPFAWDPVNSRIDVLEVVHARGVPKIVKLGQYVYAPNHPDEAVATRAWTTVGYFPHDMTAQKHPLTGQHLAYLSYWDAGAIVVDISNPAAPREVAIWDDFDEVQNGNIHYAQPFDHLIDGKHITVTSPEWVANDTEGSVNLLDTTDPANPVRLGTWRMPGHIHWNNTKAFSPHYFGLRNGTIILGAYHGGIWSIDVSTAERLAEPVALGYYFPHGPGLDDPRSARFAGDWGQAPSVWNAWFDERGYVYASDVSGLYVLKVTNLPAAIDAPWP